MTHRCLTASGRIGLAIGRDLVSLVWRNGASIGTLHAKGWFSGSGVRAFGLGWVGARRLWVAITVSTRYRISLEIT
jgi:hypothetical protein